ncbi:MAG: NADH-quinone oxidoreductase subunit NuoE [Opitutales bacterium]
MLSDEERKELDHEAEHYDYKQALCIEALKIVQNHRGWVSDDAIKDIAEYLGMDPTEVDSVATFYNLIYRQPVGRNKVHVCDSVSCHILGYEKIIDHFRERYGIGWGETTEDDRFTLIPNQCLGACDRAPCILVNYELHGPLDAPEKIEDALNRYA